MANAYFYSNTAIQTSLSSGISNSGASIIVGATTGFPVSYPYVLALDYGGSAEELVTITAAAGTTLTIGVRGFGGTSAQSHNPGAVVRHVYNAQDATDYRTHEGNSSGVHGVAGSVVGTTDTQTLTNKTLTAPTISAAVFSGTSTGGTFSGGTYNTATLASPTITGTVAGGASYTAPTITGTVAGGATYQQPVFTPSSNLNVPVLIKAVASPAANQLEIRDSTNALQLAVSQAFQLISAQEIQSGAGGAAATLLPNGQITASPVATNVTPFLAQGAPSGTVDVAIFSAGGTTGLRVDSAAVTHVPVGLKAGSSDQFSVDANGRPKSTTFTSAYVSDTTSNVISNTAYAAITTPSLSATCTVPPSGKVLIMGTVRQDINANHYVFSSFNVSGSVSNTIKAPLDNESLIVGDTQTYIQDGNSLVTSITSANPGETLTVTWQHKVDTAGGSANIYARTIILIPLIG